jgi:pimeloyl-ACP methyl ester carboxylesterase
LTAGRYDGCTPGAAAQDAAAIAGAEIAVFEHSAHMPHLEEREPYMAVLRGFLRRTEAA